MKVIHEAIHARYVVQVQEQEDGARAWVDYVSFDYEEDAIERADHFADAYPNSKYRVIDTQG